MEILKMSYGVALLEPCNVPVEILPGDRLFPAVDMADGRVVIAKIERNGVLIWSNPSISLS